MSKRIEISAFGNDPNLGLHAYVNDDYAIVNPNLRRSEYNLIKEVLDVDIIKTSIGEVSLVGAMINGIGNKIVVPYFIDKKEEKKLLDKGFEILKIESPLTALGNNLLIGKNGIIANPQYKQKVIEQISEFFGLKLQKMKLAKLVVPGSLGIFINEVLVIGNIVSPEEKEFLEEFFGTEVEEGSINFGSPYMKSGILCNKKGMLIGNLSGTAEIVMLDEIFNRGVNNG